MAAKPPAGIVHQGSLSDFLDGPAPPPKAPRNPDQALIDLQPPELREIVAAHLAKGRGHARAGRTAQRVGQRFEDLFTPQHREWARKKSPNRILAWEFHPEAGAKYVPDADTGGKKLVHRTKACADFVMLTLRGQLVVMECKSVDATDGNRLYRRVVRPQQADQLDETAAAGQVALLAVEFRVERAAGALEPHLRRFVVPWATFPWVVLDSAQSVCAEDLAGFEMPERGRYLDRFLCASPRHGSPRTAQPSR